VLGRPRIHVPECESTQLLLDASLPEGAVASTDHQSGGRGRLGRTWVDAPAAALLFSVLLKPPPSRRAAELTLIAGLATAEAIGPAAQLKWPNDVLVDGKKVAGGLGELRDGVVVLGIGVNVNQTAEQLPSDARTPAASLRTLDGVVREREEVLDAILRRLDDAYRAWLAGGLEALHERVAARDFLRGRAVTVNGTSGTAHGIRPDGRLEVGTAAGPVAVDSGDVVVFA
jgi:BirA family transcriptional regulator, biotin operon repressor / biotin---[acetyl-CoA-carboxylase] ligase